MFIVLRVQLLEVDQKRSTAPRRNTEPEAGPGGVSVQDMQAEVDAELYCFLF